MHNKKQYATTNYLNKHVTAAKRKPPMPNCDTREFANIYTGRLLKQRRARIRMTDENRARTTRGSILCEYCQDQSVWRPAKIAQPVVCQAQPATYGPETSPSDSPFCLQDITATLCLHAGQGDSTSVENYRPIALTPTFAKIRKGCVLRYGQGLQVAWVLGWIALPLYSIWF